MRLLVDLNLSPAWVGVLRQAGFDAIRWSGIGPPNAPDTIIFAWAREHSHIVFTHDMDFGAILAATGADSHSVFQIRTNDVSPKALAPRAISLLHRFSPQLLACALVVVDEARELVRILQLNFP